MDELLHHCLRELSFDGDLGKYLYYHHVMVATCAGSNPIPTTILLTFDG